METGETLLEAAARELFEELDLSVTSLGRIEFSFTDETTNFVIHFAEVHAQGNPKPLEHTTIRWASVQELFKLSMAPSDTKFVHQIMEQQKSKSR